MKSEHSLARRITWHPLVATLPLAWFIYNIATRPFSAFRLIGLVVVSAYFALAWFDALTSHRFLNWMYSDDEKPAAEDNEESAQRAELWNDHKSQLMERALGKEHDMVMHAIIPYAIGGGLDLYYFPNGIAGTAIATKELSEMPNEGSSNSVYKSYELVMFTREPLSLDDAKNKDTPFGRAHSNINVVLNYIALYSAEAKLNPRETCEFPADFENVGGKCFIFDGYAKFSDDLADNFGLLAVIEIFRSEMTYARENGGEMLLTRLKDSGHYPYSDLDRQPVA